MKRMIPLLLLFPFAAGAAGKPAFKLTPNWSSYFAAEVSKIEASGLSGVTNLDQWKGVREQRRHELAEMLGLWPAPERTPLNPVVTGVLEQDEFRVEKVQFQASPHLYVTGDLYLPRKLDHKAPAILYVCGHSQVITNGVSCGNKAAYQHHGEWFARNGFVCLTIDTLQYGEILGSHRGTYSENQWWWNSRGYTPAGVEAWFGIRALDYLCSRPEVDVTRIGMTGRSGGGAYTWTVAALDDRVKVAAPVAGMTDLRNQVLDGKVDGHCDCMFPVNTYRWDLPMIGALIAPRPLLIGNSDKDHIFPLDGVMRTHDQIRQIYRLYGCEKDFGIVITEGDHMDTSDLQIPVFRWFARYLRPGMPEDLGKEPRIDARLKYFAPDQLRVFDKLPKDELNTTAAKWFNLHPAEFQAQTADPEALRKALRAQVFAGCPASDPPTSQVLRARSVRTDGVRIDAYDLPIQPGITQQLYSVSIASPTKPRHITLIVADDALLKDSALGELEKAEPSRIIEVVRRLAPDNDGTVHLFIPRAVGDPIASTPANATSLRRRFMLVGQTLDSMRVWDIRCAISALGQLYGKMPITIAAAGQMAVNASYAALFQPEVKGLDLREVPQDPNEYPDYLNVLKIVQGIPSWKPGI